MQIKINWIYEGERGSWTSSESRFSINPGGFRHGTRPDFYELHDGVQAPTEYDRANKFDTVLEAKMAALNIAKNDLRRRKII